MIRRFNVRASIFEAPLSSLCLSALDPLVSTMLDYAQSKARRTTVSLEVDLMLEE